MDLECGEVEESDFVIPADKTYAVVELIDDVPNEEGESDPTTYACAAPTTWLSDVIRRENENGQVKYYATVDWPRNESKLNALLEKRTKPPVSGPNKSKTWKVYELARVLKFCRSLGVAKTESNKALQMSLSESDGNAESTQKRNSHQPSRFGSAIPSNIVHTDHSSSDSEGPPIKLQILQDSSHGKGGSFSSSSRLSNKGSPAQLRKTPSASGQATGNSIDTSSGTGITSPVSVTVTSGEKRSDTDEVSRNMNSVEGSPPKELSKSNSKVGHLNSPSTSVQGSEQTSSSQPLNVSTNSSHQTSIPAQVPKSNSSKPVNNYTIMRELQEMKETMAAMSLTISKIFNFVCPAIESSGLVNGVPGLPISSFESMTKWEEFLQDKDNCLHAVVLLSERCVITNLKDSVYNMLKFMISNQMASSYNHKGKNKKGCKFQKAAFIKSNSYFAINSALKRFSEFRVRDGMPIPYSTGEPLVSSIVALWLKDAPKRYLNELKLTNVLGDEITGLPIEYYLPIPPDFFEK